jgi:hypothetical protein
MYSAKSYVSLTFVINKEKESKITSPLFLFGLIKYIMNQNIEYIPASYSGEKKYGLRHG